MPETERHIDTTPMPVRYWWLKRISVGLVVLLVLLVLLRLGWGRIADRRLQAEIDRIVAAGEPIFPQDFDSPSIPDDRNAVVVLKQAVTAWEAAGAKEQERELDNREDTEPPDQRYWAQVEPIVEANANSLALLRKARAMPDAEWDIRITSPATNFMMPRLGGQRALGKLLGRTASYRYHTGNHDEAIETLRDVLALGRAVDKHPMAHFFFSKLAQARRQDRRIHRPSVDC